MCVCECVFVVVRGCDETDLKSNHENHKTGTFWKQKCNRRFCWSKAFPNLIYYICCISVYIVLYVYAYMQFIYYVSGFLGLFKNLKILKYFFFLLPLLHAIKSISSYILYIYIYGIYIGFFLDLQLRFIASRYTLCYL